MKQNIAYDELKFEQENVLDEACTIYPNLLEVRKKLPNIYKDFEKMYQEMCHKLDSECATFEDARNIVNLIFRMHGCGINFDNRSKEKIFFLSVSENTVDNLMFEVEQFKLWVD